MNKCNHNAVPKSTMTFSFSRDHNWMPLEEALYCHLVQKELHLNVIMAFRTFCSHLNGKISTYLLHRAKSTRNTSSYSGREKIWEQWPSSSYLWWWQVETSLTVRKSSKAYFMFSLLQTCSSDIKVHHISSHPVRHNNTGNYNITTCYSSSHPATAGQKASSVAWPENILTDRAFIIRWPIIFHAGWPPCVQFSKNVKKDKKLAHWKKSSSTIKCPLQRTTASKFLQANFTSKRLASAGMPRW